MSARILHRGSLIVLVMVAAACWGCRQMDTRDERSADMPEAYGAPLYGAPEADSLGPVGGGVGYTEMVTEYDFLVTNVQELRDALRVSRSGQVVYIADDSEIDMTVWVRACREHIIIPAGVILASGRGQDTPDGPSLGGLIYSDEFDTFPLIATGGANVRITGLRLRGPDQKFRGTELIEGLNAHPELTSDGKGYYSFPVSQGVRVAHPGLVIDNCELWGWGHAAIAPGRNAGGTHIHHNHIRHCQRAGLGYGICIDGSDALIEANLFDYTRHAVAATGIPGTGYEARNNVHGEHSVGHTFDMHGSAENGIEVDGRSIGGEWIRIHHNTLKARDAGVGIRGIPRSDCEIHHNWFFSENKPESVRLSGNALDNPDALGMHDNIWGPDRVRWTYTGAPR